MLKIEIDRQKLLNVPNSVISGENHSVERIALRLASGERSPKRCLRRQRRSVEALAIFGLIVVALAAVISAWIASGTWTALRVVLVGTWVMGSAMGYYFFRHGLSIRGEIFESLLWSLPGGLVMTTVASLVVLPMALTRRYSERKEESRQQVSRAHR